MTINIIYLTVEKLVIMIRFLGCILEDKIVIRDYRAYRRLLEITGCLSVVDRRWLDNINIS